MATPTVPRESTERRPAILGGVLRAHGETLRRRAARHCSVAADVDDALQDACVEFLCSYAGGPGEHALRYLMLAVKHASWARSRRARGETTTPPSPSTTTWS
jgi:DNA-directed RNA polymerase specialized sigma24 family protein